MPKINISRLQLALFDGTFLYDRDTTKKLLHRTKGLRRINKALDKGLEKNLPSKLTYVDFSSPLD